jgi:hypothetical protein
LFSKTCGEQIFEGFLVLVDNGFARNIMHIFKEAGVSRAKKHQKSRRIF